MRIRVLAGLFVAFTAFGPSARADEVTVKAAYKLAREHLAAERWSTAVDSLKKLLVNNPGSSTVLEQLGAIEADLRLAMFRLQAKHPSAENLFGKAAQGFVVADRRLTLDYPSGPEGADWEERGAAYDHRIPFDSDVAVEFLAPTIEAAAKSTVGIQLLGAGKPGSAAATGSYLITPGACSEDPDWVYVLQGSVVRFDAGAAAAESTRDLVKKPTPGKVKLGQVQRYRVVRRGLGINVSVDGKPFLVCEDGKYPVTTVSLNAAKIRNLTIRGVVEKAFYHDLLEKRFAVEQRAWEPAGYVRAEVLPKWVLDAAPAPPAAPEPGK